MSTGSPSARAISSSRLPLPHHLHVPPRQQPLHVPFRVTAGPGVDRSEGQQALRVLGAEAGGELVAGLIQPHQIGARIVDDPGALDAGVVQAAQKGLLKEALDLKETANFIIISLNGAAALYISSRDRSILEQTIRQLRFFIQQLRKQET